MFVFGDGCEVERLRFLKCRAFCTEFEVIKCRVKSIEFVSRLVTGVVLVGVALLIRRFKGRF